MSGSVSAFSESDGEKRRAFSTASAELAVSVLRAVARRSSACRDSVRVFETSSTICVARRCRSRAGSRASRSAPGGFRGKTLRALERRAVGMILRERGEIRTAWRC